jgi:hypothetical protein
MRIPIAIRVKIAKRQGHAETCKRRFYPVAINRKDHILQVRRRRIPERVLAIITIAATARYGKHACKRQHEYDAQGASPQATCMH